MAIKQHNAKALMLSYLGQTSQTMYEIHLWLSNTFADSTIRVWKTLITIPRCLQALFS